VVIIARDEADRLPAAIRSVAFAEEVLVLDSGSSDATMEVARRLGARVVETDWPGHVAQKNRGLGMASHDWVLSIDADERVSPALAAAVRAVLEREPEQAGFAVSRRNFYLGRALRAGGWYPDRRLRLVRRRRARWRGQDPHDLLAVEGPTGCLQGDLLHHPYRDLGEHLSTIDRYSRRFVEVSEARARWYDLALRPPWRFARGYLLQAGFLDGVRGLMVAVLGAVHCLLKWGRLYLAQREPAGSDSCERGRDDS